MKRILGKTSLPLKQALARFIGASMSVAISIAFSLVCVDSSKALAAELNGFRLESQSDGSLSVNVQADSLPTYEIEPSGNGVSITLKDTHLSESLRQKGMPVVIDNRNRAIGRAVPGEDNTVKIVIPNWKPEQGALRIKNDTMTSVSEGTRGTVRPSSAPSERLTGAFQSQFKSAAQALSRPAIAPLGDTTVSLPAVETTTQPRSNGVKSNARRKKVTYRPMVTPPSTALPKVVQYNQPSEVPQLAAPKPVVNVSEAPSSSPLSAPVASSRSAATLWPVVAQPIPTPQSAGWGSYDQSSEIENPYGLNSIADAAEATVAPNSSSMGAQLKHFFDGITGNRFSRPYGVAFWAMMVGVIFVACLGFLALAIGLLCTRLVFTPFGGNASNPVRSQSAGNKKNIRGLFSWRNLSPDDDEESPTEETQPVSLRGPVAKRFPFVASGLSHAAAMYTPQSDSPRRTSVPPAASSYAPKSLSERTAPLNSSRQRENNSPPSSPIQPESTAALWRPHVGVTSAPTMPALIRGHHTSSVSQWSHPEDDGDLIQTTSPSKTWQSPVERALHRLTR